MPWSSDHIKELALEVGLDDIGFVPAQRLDQDAAFMEQWLSGGFHGDMDYLTRNREKRYDIRELVPGAHWVIVALLTYAHSGHDYHRAVKTRLYNLAQKMGLTSADTFRVCCDSAPVLERRLATLAGLGQIGRNHQLIHPTLGSYIHIGELVVCQPVQGVVNQEQNTDQTLFSVCETCNKCVEACPGHALGKSHWDARQCVAYVTHKCTICQQVCPLNPCSCDK